MVKASAEEERHAARVSRPHHAGKLHDRKRREQNMRLDPLDQAPDGELRHGAAEKHRGGQTADRDQGDAGADALVNDFRQRHRDGVEDEAGAQRHHDEEPKNHHRELRREVHVRGFRARGRMAFLLFRHHPQIDRGGQDAHDPRHQECAAPRERRRQCRRDAGGERNAEIAADAVEGERAAAMGGLLDHHRGRPGDRWRRICRARTAPRQEASASARKQPPPATLRSRHKNPPSCCGGSSGRRASPPAARTIRTR